ncbi:PLP-dependent aminotransferase family protein [Dyella tabacisoli]|uniref:PLP-dependent aminotransferase family protein n=1 Tax=Dyella tabacisoli TaxID=2282381 RepID=A0A369UQ64_9GAMM|nr:PLP-dependent aminotransferase family protein [Dyella tabacisoli]RDD82185.1 PLP-dependent aminotransferase family protein [Dyella tabacisoli]
MDPLFEIEIERPVAGSRDAGRFLYRQLKDAIQDGRLTAGTQLPASRKSAAFFGLSRNSVAEVYDRLSNEGLVVARHGSGTYVADLPPEPASLPSPASTYRLNTFWLQEDVTAAMGFWRDDSPTVSRAEAPIDFRPALIDSRLFPFDVYRRVSAKQLRGLEKKPAAYKSPQGNQGNFHLRAAITNHIALTRAVACRPEDVVVTAGAQQAFDLLARILVTPGETVVAVEDPGYPPMRVAFAAAGARIVPVPVDEEGLVVDSLPPGVSVICVCPSHQFPLGVTMSKCRRTALVNFARQHGAVIVEDDYDGEFRYEGNPLQSLRAADPADVVFYVGTFSKCMLPSLRLGFMVVPDWARRTLVAAKNCLDWHCSTPLQTGVCAFIAEGHLAHHVRKMRQIYRRRRQLLLDLLKRDFSDWLEPIPSLYGMHIAAWARPGVDLDAAVDALAARAVKIHTLERYHLMQSPRSGLVFGYGAVDLPEIERGLAALKEVLSRSRLCTGADIFEV